MKEVNVENQKNNCVEEECVKIPTMILDIMAEKGESAEVIAVFLELAYKYQYPESDKQITKLSEDEWIYGLKRYDEIVKQYINEIEKNK